MPALCFVLLRANPPTLLSNLQVCAMEMRCVLSSADRMPFAACVFVCVRLLFASLCASFLTAVRTTRALWTCV
jgi:hypothetical protein